MSEEWPDDDKRFTGPKARLDKIGGVASGSAFTPKRKAKKLFAVCELVHKIMHSGPHHTKVVECAARVKIVKEYAHEHAADVAAAEHAVKLGESPPVAYKATVVVISVWRVL